MNLTMSALGWFHSLCCLYAMWVGGQVLLSSKGGVQHQTRGRQYLIAAALLNASALGVYKIGGFQIFHWMAIATLIIIFIAFAAAYWKRPHGIWLRVHLTAIILSYYMLWGGAVNEAFLRINVLKKLAHGTATIGIVHTFFIAILLMSIAYYWGKTSRPAGKDANLGSDIKTL